MNAIPQPSADADMTVLDSDIDTDEELFEDDDVLVEEISIDGMCGVY